MFFRTTMVAAAAAIHLSSLAQPADSTAELRVQLQQLREQYEARIKALEQRLDAAEKAQSAPPPPAPTEPTRAAAAPVPPALAGLAASLVLVGNYANLSKDPAAYRIQGFIPGGEKLGPGKRSFSLGESELMFNANVDPYFSGRLTMALSPEETVEVEEAFFRTTSLARGLTLTGGRSFTSIGYLNTQDAHAWDFVDAPLAYMAFFGGRHRTDGVQLKWIAPIATYVELSAGVGRGDAFPGNDRNRNSMGDVSLGARIGRDLGESANWRAGLSYLRSRSRDRTYEDTDGTGTAVVNAFTGKSDTYVLDAVFKWAPEGNRKTTSFKLQGEYVWRRERGTLTYDLDGQSRGTAADAYRARQAGWYLQGVYQFAGAWRVGLRHDRLRSGSSQIGLVSNGTLSAADLPRLVGFNPRRTGAALDFSFSEFSRFRLQVSRDQAQPGVSDRQIYLQYQMTLGAHGAHSY